MRKFEITFLCITVLGIILSFMLIPVATLLYLLASLILMSFYLIFGAALFNGIGFRAMFKKESWKNIKASWVLAGIFTGFCCMASILGIIYKVTMWPGADMLGLNTLVLSLIATALGFLVSRWAGKAFMKRTFYRTVPLSVILLALMNVSRANVLEFKYRNYPDLVEATKNVWANPGDPNAHIKHSEEIEKMMLDRR